MSCSVVGVEIPDLKLQALLPVSVGSSRLDLSCFVVTWGKGIVFVQSFLGTSLVFKFETQTYYIEIIFT